MRYFIIILSIFSFSFAYSQDETDNLDNNEDIIEIEEEQEIEFESEFYYTISPSLGFTFQSLSRSADDETADLQWLFSLNALLDYKAEDWHLNSSLFIQYGQLHRESEFPEKTQDNFLFSLMPSTSLIDLIGLRLFFETSVQTNLASGNIDGYETKAFDPMYLQETIFIGHKFTKETDESDFSLIFGLGYAFQEIITNDFVLAETRDFQITPENPLSNVQDQMTLESGYSGVFKLMYNAMLLEEISFSNSVNFVAFTKESFFEAIENASVTGLITSSLQYSYFSLDYTFYLFYDPSISVRRQLDQTLLFSLRLDL